MSAVIWMAFQDGEAAVKLFQQHYTRQFVRERDLPKGKDVIRGGARGLAPAVGRANREEKLLSAVRLVILEKVCDLLRGELPATRVEQHQHRLGARGALLY